MTIPTHAISIRQPFAEMILRGEKLNELRSWPLPAKWIGVPLAIQTPATVGMEGYPEARDLWERMGRPDLSALVGAVTFGRPSARAVLLHLWAWPVVGAMRLSSAVPCLGARGVWPIPQDIRAEVASRLSAISGSEL